MSDKKRGERYAEEQITGSYFLEWVYEQMLEASRMDPSEVLPLDTKSDAQEVARNMLQQLQWDMKRDTNESAEFFRGVSEYFRNPEVVDWLADEVLYRWGEITGSETRVSETTDRGEARKIVDGAIRRSQRSGGKVVEIDASGDLLQTVREILHARSTGADDLGHGDTEWSGGIGPGDRWIIFTPGTTRGLSESPRVADFNTLPDLISHAANDLGATHISGEGAHTKIYFPRGGQYPYEEATVRRKAGYWHADGPHARAGVERLPADAMPIARARGRRAAEAPRGRGRAKKDASALLDRMNAYANDLAQSRGISHSDAVLRMSTQPEIHAKALGVSPVFVKMWAQKDREQAERLGTLKEAPRGRAKKYRPTKNWRLHKIYAITPSASGQRVEFEDALAVTVHGGHGRSDLLYAMKPVDLRHENRSPGPESRREYQYAALVAVLDGRPAEFVVDSDGDVRANLK